MVMESKVQGTIISSMLSTFCPCSGKHRDYSARRVPRSGAPKAFIKGSCVRVHLLRCACCKTRRPPSHWPLGMQASTSTPPLPPPAAAHDLEIPNRQPCTLLLPKKKKTRSHDDSAAMSDPLSVAASCVGLITASGATARAIMSFVRDCREARTA